MKRFYCLNIILIVISLAAFSQNLSQKNGDVYVDSNGILRWLSSDNEVSLFGVNYTTPFAYAYRAHTQLGLSLKKAIELDVDQMARLGFDAYRVHVWDREISDTLGNLLQNEHLDLFDYLLAKLADRGIKTIITPIAWWGNGWPEPDEKTPGFSEKYLRLELITNPTARKAERNYLKQFIQHKNPYRKLSCNDDPAIIAVEIINEPTHPENGAEVTEYINEMTDVLAHAGFHKPVFYNISQNWNDVQANAVAGAHIAGVSFQWYPTDLVHGKMIKGNYLRNVSQYLIPSNHVAGYAAKAKMVYEFDAADVGGAYLYPAMTRSFREAGMQFATMFSYDPSQIAYANTEYPTHYMNLLYTPSKAISLMVAGKAFHKLPRMKSYGIYPANNQFGDFRVSEDEDLSEMNTETEFLFSHSTASNPRNAAALQHIAGCGHSPVVTYDGSGAYFLDKQEEGVWKFEVYPDVLWLRDPFEPTSLSRQVARLFWNERRIKITLPDLEEYYSLFSSSNPDLKFDRNVSHEYLVKPGKYIVARNNIGKNRLAKYFDRNEKFLDGLYIPPGINSGVYAVNKSAEFADTSDPSAFRFQIAGDRGIAHASLFIKRFGWHGFAKFRLKNVGGFEYALADTPKILQTGKLEYCIAVESEGNVTTFPGGMQRTLDQPDFLDGALWSIMVVDPPDAVSILDVSRDIKDLVFPHFDGSIKYSTNLQIGSKSNETSLSVHINFLAASHKAFGAQLNVRENLKPFAAQLDQYKTATLRARSIVDSVCALGINLILKDGRCFSSSIKLKSQWQDQDLPLSAFQAGSSLLLPNSYPLFLPQTWNSPARDSNNEYKLSDLEFIQIVVNPADGITETDFEVVSVVLKK